MDVKDVVKRAKSYLIDLIADENPTNVGLEEIEYDEQEQIWSVTIGFSRPWNSMVSAYTAISGQPSAKRAYRVLKINNADGKVLSLTRRDFGD